MWFNFGYMVELSRVDEMKVYSNAREILSSCFTLCGVKLQFPFLASPHLYFIQWAEAMHDELIERCNMVIKKALDR